MDDSYNTINLINYHDDVVTFLFARPKRKVTKRKRAPKSKRNDGFPAPPASDSRTKITVRESQHTPSSPTRKPVDFGS